MNDGKKGLSEKPAAKFYAAKKRTIKYEHCYRNSYNSKLYARARLNALQLEEHKGRSGVSFCLRCRQKPHTSMECTFCRYCSYCDRETGDGEVDHTNKMHLELMEKGKGEIIARHRAERNRKTYSNE